MLKEFIWTIKWLLTLWKQSQDYLTALWAALSLWKMPSKKGWKIVFLLYSLQIIKSKSVQDLKLWTFRQKKGIYEKVLSLKEAA